MHTSGKRLTWRSATVVSGLFAAFVAWTLLERLPTQGDLVYAEGTVESVGWTGLRHPRFLIQFVGDRRVFQSRATSYMPLSLDGRVKPGDAARIGHTDDVVGTSDRLMAYSIHVDGRAVYTVEQYNEGVRDDNRKKFFAFFLPSLMLTIFCLWRWRQKASREAA